MTPLDYWKECLCNSAEECDLELTVTQLDALAEAAENGHEHYGQAFYSPPSSDRIDDIESAHKRKITELEREHRKTMDLMESATKRLAKLHHDERIYVEDGEWKVMR
jgi:hypothetical protein